jgi:hypothetical protein
MYICSRANPSWFLKKEERTYAFVQKKKEYVKCKAKAER